MTTELIKEPHDQDTPDDVFVRMCETATELQPKDVLGTGVVWCLRQEELQAMAPYADSLPSQIHILHDFMESLYPPNAAEEDKSPAEMVFDTWKQVWLALVMKEKYGKVWNGETWI